MKNKVANNYFKDSLNLILNESMPKPSRGKYSDGNSSYRLSVSQMFEIYKKGDMPIHTYRFTPIKTAIQEILWIYQDQSSFLDDANYRGVNWWNDFAIKGNSIGKAYGYTVGEFRLISKLLKSIETNPFGTRHILSLWQEDNLQYQYANKGLVPCAFLTQYSVREVGIDAYEIDMHLEMRSSDYIMAGAINRIQYYALGLMICGHLRHCTGKDFRLGSFSIFTMDMHIYDRHIDFAKELILRQPCEDSVSISLDVNKYFYDYKIEDFEIINSKNIFKPTNKLDLVI